MLCGAATVPVSCKEIANGSGVNYGHFGFHNCIVTIYAVSFPREFRPIRLLYITLHSSWCPLAAVMHAALV